jgi:hypothetical protein
LTAEQNRWYAEEVKIDPMSKIRLSPYINLAGRAPGLEFRCSRLSPKAASSMGS